MVAAWAWPTELGAAGWTNLEVVLDTIVAGRARLALSHLGQQRLLFKLALIQLGQGLAWPHDEIDEETTNVEDSHQRGRRHLQDDILCPRAYIAPGPEDETQPENDGKGYNEEDDNPYQVLQRAQTTAP